MAATTDLSEVSGYISSLQRDGRLLLRHLARRSDRALPESAPAGTSTDGTPSDGWITSSRTGR